MAAPSAWTTRAATSRSNDGATPQSAEATVNSPTPATNARRRPSRSVMPATHDEEGGEDDVVRVEDPGQAGDRRRREGLPDRREGDVDDGRVEEGQEGAEAGDQQHPRRGDTCGRRRSHWCPPPRTAWCRRPRSLAGGTRPRKRPRPATRRGSGAHVVAVRRGAQPATWKEPRFRPCPGPALRFTPPCRAGFRAVAQLGSALDWGSRGRRFKSCQPDREETAGQRPEGPRGLLTREGLLLPPLTISLTARYQRAHPDSGYHSAAAALPSACAADVIRRPRVRQVGREVDLHRVPEQRSGVGWRDALTVQPERQRVPDAVQGDRRHACRPHSGGSGRSTTQAGPAAQRVHHDQAAVRYAAPALSRSAACRALSARSSATVPGHIASTGTARRRARSWGRRRGPRTSSATRP